MALVWKKNPSQKSKELYNGIVEGRSVDLGEFGSMNVTLKSTGVENEEDFTTDHIKRNRVHFRPSVKFSNLMKNVKYEREEE